MNVGFDVTSLLYHRGVSRYTSNLLQSLLHQPNLQLHLYGSSFRQHQQLLKLINQELALQAGAKSKTSVTVQQYPPSLQHWMWNVLGINSLRKSLPKIDVFHSWDWIQPPDKNLPLVSTIHDLAILRFPDTAHEQISKMHQASWKKLKSTQADIIAVSRATKNDLIELLDFAPEKIHVIYEALPRQVKIVSEAMSEEEHDLIRERLRLDKPFILCVGTREPRKNLERLIEAWKPLAKDFELVIAGAAGWDSTSTEVQHYPPQLRFLGQVSEKELSVLYGEASVLAYPSLYEGFGLPILEAFYYGTPVVTSNTSSMPEVAGNAAELVDPMSVESIRKGLEKVLGESLMEQQQRLQKMIIRLQLFNWEHVATQTVAVYKNAIASHL